MRNKDWAYVIVLAIISFLLPRIMLFYFLCGIADFVRSNDFSVDNWKRYFLGNGILTWALSPFNLFMDLLCLRNKKVYQLADLPQKCQDEISELMQTANSKPEIITNLTQMMAEKKRGMLFFKWYGKNINTSIAIPEFHKDFEYIRTIGVSVFSPNQETSLHYGPLRITLRVLYNLLPVHSEKVYIVAANNKHFWHDNPLFIFDDTLLHQSTNGSDNMRYVMFVDIFRPSKHLNVLGIALSIVRFFMQSVNRIFYKNWEMLR